MVGVAVTDFEVILILLSFNEFADGSVIIGLLSLLPLAIGFLSGGTRVLIRCRGLDLDVLFCFIFFHVIFLFLVDVQPVDALGLMQAFQGARKSP